MTSLHPKIRQIPLQKSRSHPLLPCFPFLYTKMTLPKTVAAVEESNLCSVEHFRILNRRQTRTNKGINEEARWKGRFRGKKRQAMGQ